MTRIGVAGAYLAITAALVLAIGGPAFAAPKGEKGGGSKASSKKVQPSRTSIAFCEGDCPIQPGAFVSTPEGGCTMNYVFRDSQGKMYIGTAGHCFERVGQRAEAEPNPGSPVSILDPLFEFGTAVFVEFSEEEPSIDFALIEIDPEDVGKVNPAMRRWGGPTGVTSAAETNTGDLLLQYGYGVGFDLTPATRPRPRVLMDDDSRHYTSQSASNFGDSGSPVLHRPTGKALGIDSRFNLFDVPPSTDAGPTVENIMRQLAGAGRGVTLVTGAYPAP